MKPTMALMAAGIALIITSIGWWSIDSVRFGSPLVYSRDFKQVTVTEIDPVFGTEVQTTHQEPGPFLGLLDLAFPFGALPMAALGLGLFGASFLARKRSLRFASATLSMLLVVPIASLATSFAGASPGMRTVSLNDAVRQNEVKFISRAPLENIEGVADEIRGSFSINPTMLEQTQGKIIVDVKSMKTGVAKRDDHMMGRDWLDAAAFPTITYDISGLKNVKVVSSGSGKTTITATAVGSFTLHGVTKSLEAGIKLTYVNESDATKSRADGDLVMIEATFDVAWQQFGVVGRKSFNDKVSQNIQITASLYGNTDS
jgi:polyisoprenoid-binding protein YceI